LCKENRRLASKGTFRTESSDQVFTFIQLQLVCSLHLYLEICTCLEHSTHSPFLQISIKNMVNKENVAFFLINNEELHLTFVIFKSPKFSGYMELMKYKIRQGSINPVTLCKDRRSTCVYAKVMHFLIFQVIFVDRH